MKDIKELAKLINSFEQELGTCSRCGMCQAVCPIFNITLHEADVARGKLALLSGLAKELFKNSKKVDEYLNRCLLCGSCENTCTSSVNALEIYLKARIILTRYQGLSGAKKIILRNILSNPKQFDRMFSFLAKFQNIFLKKADTQLQTLQPRIISPLLHNRHILPLAPVPFHKSIPFPDTSPKAPDIKVAFFTGCLLDKMFPRIAHSVVKVLTHHNVGIFLPGTQGCCGIPALALGDDLSFDRLVEHNANLFSRDNYDYLVTACPTCTFVIKKIWPIMFSTDSAEMKSKIHELSKKAIDINDFLVTRIGISDKKEKGTKGRTKITFHDPCHLKKSLGISEEPRTLISATPGCSLVEMPESDGCCGMGGSFNLKHYGLSIDIGKKKREHVISSDCSIVATSCPACMVQLSDLLAQSKASVAVKHVMEIYAQGLDNEL